MNTGITAHALPSLPVLETVSSSETVSTRAPPGIHRRGPPASGTGSGTSTLAPCCVSNSETLAIRPRPGPKAGSLRSGRPLTFIRPVDTSVASVRAWKRTGAPYRAFCVLVLWPASRRGACEPATGGPPTEREWTEPVTCNATEPRHRGSLGCSMKGARGQGVIVVEDGEVLGVLRPSASALVHERFSGPTSMRFVWPPSVDGSPTSTRCGRRSGDTEESTTTRTSGGPETRSRSAATSAVTSAMRSARR
jgi:hypothetical protein